MKNNGKEKKDFSKKIVLIFLIVALFVSITINIVLYISNTKKEAPNAIDENVVFFGDSITDQYEVDKYYPKKNVINSGISGNKTEDLINRIDEDVYKYNPSKVFLLIGINDLCINVEEKDILFNIQTIINGIKNNRRNAIIYVESIYPVNTKKMVETDYGYCRQMYNNRIKSINKKIKDMCIESGVNYIDVYSKLVDKEGYLKELYTREGLHLNNLGYLKVTSVLNKYFYQ